MGASKNHQYSVHTNDLARTAKALGHSARVTILSHLSQNGAISHEEILRLTQLSIGTVCQHLCELREAGLIYPFYYDRPVYLLAEAAPKMVGDLQLIIQHQGNQKII